MRQYLPGIFALIVLAAGWYYIFYSPAAKRLSGIEDQRLNTFRVRLRRANGVVMMLLAIALYALVETVTEPRSFTWVFMSVVILLATMIVLALIDLQLTRRLREKKGR